MAQYVTRGTWKARCDLAQINICQITKYGIKAWGDLAQINMSNSTVWYHWHLKKQKQQNLNAPDQPEGDADKSGQKSK